MIGGIAKLGKQVLEGASNARPQADLLTDTVGLAHDKTVIGAVESAGLAASADDAAERARQVETALKKYDKIEQAVKAATDRSSTSLRWLRRITDPIEDPNLEEMWDSFSPRDTMKLIHEMLRRALEGKAVIHNFVAGAVREMVAKNIGKVQDIVTSEKIRIREIGKREDNVCFIDTGVMGDVLLPTKIFAADGRAIELGTDRIIGIGRGNPETVTLPGPSGELITLNVQGELEVTVAIEVKGRSTVAGGRQQVEALFAQGRGMQGYAIIDGKFWLLRYNPANVNHVVVAPPGPDFAAVKSVTKLTSGGKLTVVEIPLDLDRDILGMAGALIGEVRDDLAATGKVLNRGKPSKKKKTTP
jgi:hypothetical protein